MLKLNSSCHNYEIYKEKERCPLVSVCNEDCVFVWKALYDEKIDICNPETEDLRDEVEDLHFEINRLNAEICGLETKIMELEGEEC